MAKFATLSSGIGQIERESERKKGSENFGCETRYAETNAALQMHPGRCIKASWGE